MFGFNDPTFILIIPVFILALYAQFKVKSNYNKFREVPNRKGVTGKDAAEEILRNNGIFDVQVLPAEGELTDHYNPTTKEVHLSEQIFYGRSIASLSIAAHEVGHAIQHAKGYYPVILRGKILPMANIGSFAAMPLFLMGMIFSMPVLMDVGIIFFSGALLFHLVTLPVELNASSRAILQLEGGGFLTEQGEKEGCKSMLSAAALTYISSTLMALVQLLRLLILRNSRD